ncbi:hypothetical protein [Paenibacillus sp. 32352]|uniref:hypothetical protein n=1 Tax=Paenibacillus sp. 32352 TaxID=1969111 RepID=UPI0011805471|nr:hypothetical protein [Paenibacillus sp. 32352]
MNRIGFRKGEANSKGEVCWSCGHWLISGGCWINGHHMNVNKGWMDTNADDSCESWVPEKTPGTITGDIWEHVREELEGQNSGGQKNDENNNS